MERPTKLTQEDEVLDNLSEGFEEEEEDVESEQFGTTALRQNISMICGGT